MNDWMLLEVENEAHFRDMNEWTEAANDDIGAHNTMDAYICECGDAACATPIQLTRAEYEFVRTDGTFFAIAPDHENPDVDRIVQEWDRYTIVAKWFGEAARIVYATNPRR